ncbi:GGDEF domain-containing protein [Alkalimonas collagenimarina]|uniref:GGDEF domain-containing protein n=1 Tax=Alkalimonas collagenimarina TaxID=400390 RepID=A0ABT9GXK2_9GAMM|nr:GGDEF domain-containing protein [Alkalimonas collagenimarina]MDP4535786.1 GGDEF domain-containing protein [Alkalimonas collagenimarina]
MMSEPQVTNSPVLHNTVLQLQLNALHSDMRQMRCEIVVQQKLWYQEQQQLQQDKLLLALALLHAGTLHISSQAKLKKLTQDSQCDALTQTLNRSIMLDRIGHAISVSKREQSQFALLFVDLDNFKPINDNHGHAAGDAILQLVSARLTSALRDSDAVSRHGGDEFLLLLNHIKSEEDVIQLAHKIGRAITQPYQIDGHEISLSASIGMAIYPEHGSSIPDLIRYADTAMYRAKQEGGCRVR